MNESDSIKESKKRPLWVRVISITVAVILLAMIIATMICAFAGADEKTIMGLLICDILIPIFIWVFLKVTGNLSDRKKRG